jgi:CRISPR-associated protein Csx16
MRIKVDLLVTRHKALAEVLRERPELDLSEAKVIDHATAADVEGKVVVGVLPLRLAALTRRFFELSLDLPADLRGKELTADQLRQYMTGLEEYLVVRCATQQLVVALQGDDLNWVGYSLHKAPRGAVQQSLESGTTGFPYPKVPSGYLRTDLHTTSGADA